VKQEWLHLDPTRSDSSKRIRPDKGVVKSNPPVPLWMLFGCGLSKKRFLTYRTIFSPFLDRARDWPQGRQGAEAF
jgi:hypothetical protein